MKLNRPYTCITFKEKKILAAFFKHCVVVYKADNVEKIFTIYYSNSELRGVSASIPRQVENLFFSPPVSLSIPVAEIFCEIFHTLNKRIGDGDHLLTIFLNQFNADVSLMLYFQNIVFGSKIRHEIESGDGLSWLLLEERLNWYHELFQLKDISLFSKDRLFKNSFEEYIFTELEKDKKIIFQHLGDNRKRGLQKSRYQLLILFFEKIIEFYIEQQEFVRAQQWLAKIPKFKWKYIIANQGPLAFIISFLTHIYFLQYNLSGWSFIFAILFFTSTLYAFVIPSLPFLFKNLNPLHNFDLKYPIGIATPRLGMSILIGWLTILPFSDDLWAIYKNPNDKQLLIQFVILLFFVGIIFLYRLERSILKKQAVKARYFQSGFFLLFKTSAFSIFFGTVLLMLGFYQGAPELVEKVGCENVNCIAEYLLHQECQNNNLIPLIVKNIGFTSCVIPYFFPEMLILCSLVAFLISFFLQYLTDSTVYGRRL